MKWILIAIAISGCQMKSLGGGSSTSPTSPSSDPSAPSAPSAPNAPSAAGAPSEAPPPTSNSSDGQLVMPNVIGKTLEEATQIMKRAGFTTDIEQSAPVECDNPKVPGKIRCQDPEPGKHVAKYAMLQVNIYQLPDHHGTIFREELHELVGMTVDQAKARLKTFGFTGTIRVVEPIGPAPKCGFTNICDVQPESGVSQTGEIELTLKKPITIVAPPD